MGRALTDRQQTLIGADRSGMHEQQLSHAPLSAKVPTREASVVSAKKPPQMSWYVILTSMADSDDE